MSNAVIDNFLPKKVITPLVREAAKLADHWHDGQTRRVTGEPYVFHPFRVAAWLATTFKTSWDLEELIVLALLHDLLEDTKCDHAEVISLVGMDKYCKLLFLTDLDELAPSVRLLSREKRKAIGLFKLRHMPKVCLLVKVADMIDNMNSKVNNDPFWIRYAAELAERISFLEMDPYPLEVDVESNAIIMKALRDSHRGLLWRLSEAHDAK